MGAFGAESPKATQLVGTAPWIGGLKRTLSKKERAFPQLDISTSYTDTAGKQRFSGGSQLKATQAYPKGYGAATAKLIKTTPINVDDSDDEWCMDALSQEASRSRRTVRSLG